MSDNFWQTDDEGIMSEETANLILQGKTVDSGEQSYEEPYQYEEEYEDDIQEEEEEEDSEADMQVLKDASLRLEQGNLYKMLLKHDLFQGVEADPRAVANVQREIRSFIRERLEILVGLKTDPKLSKRQAPESGAGPFSDLEVTLLKQVLSKVTRNRPELNPIQQSQPRSGINPIKGSRPNAVRVAPPQKKRARPAQAKPSPQPTAPEILNKPISQMTQEEILQRNSMIKQGQTGKKAIPSDRLPMPDADQIASHNTISVQNADPGGTSLLQAIAGKLGKTLSMSETVDINSDYYDNNSRF